MIFWNFEFGKNEQFSITDYSKTIRRWKRIPNKRLLIHLGKYRSIFGSQGETNPVSALYKFEYFGNYLSVYSKNVYIVGKFTDIFYSVSCNKIFFLNKKIPVDYFALEDAKKMFIDIKILVVNWIWNDPYILLCKSRQGHILTIQIKASNS